MAHNNCDDNYSNNKLSGGFINRRVRLGGNIEDRLPGSLALNLLVVQNGAKIVRVHHVKETRLVLEALQRYQQEMNLI